MSPRKTGQLLLMHCVRAAIAMLALWPNCRADSTILKVPGAETADTAATPDRPRAAAVNSPSPKHPSSLSPSPSPSRSTFLEAQPRIYIGPPIPSRDPRGRLQLQPAVSVDNRRIVENDTGTMRSRNDLFRKRGKVESRNTPLPTNTKPMPLPSLPPDDHSDPDLFDQSAPMGPSHGIFEPFATGWCSDPALSNCQCDSSPCSCQTGRHEWPILGRVREKIKLGERFRWLCAWQQRCGPLVDLLGRHDPPTGDAGIGPSRVAHALFIIDTTQPMKNFRLRFNAGYEVTRPDQSEYFFARPMSLGGLGPPGSGDTQVETSVDYQDFIFSNEIGGPSFSVRTDVPVRVMDPAVNGNTAGLGDLAVTTKIRLVGGASWQLTQITKVITPTGNARKGLGTGHVSMESGALARYRWTESTYFHGELKLWYPLPGHPMHAGEVLRYGIGFSHLWYDSDTLAVMPTLEFVGLTFLDGLRGDVTPVDGEDSFAIHPGCRIVVDNGSDFGLFEYGIGAGINVTDQGWYRGLLFTEVRWSY